MIVRFDSIAALRAEASRHNVLNGGRWARDASTGWCGETLEQTIERSEIGYTALVPYAQELMDKIDSQIETPRVSWTRSVAGAYPCVAEAIAGFPTPMRRRAETRDEHQPITILYSINSSGSISATKLRDRGIAVLALVMALLRNRPVTLHVLFLGDGIDNGEIVFTATVNTAPLDLATACYVMTSAGFYRRIGFGMATKLNGFRGGWPKNFFKTTIYNQYLATSLTPEPSRTLVIGPVLYNDPIITNPVQWINDQILRFTRNSEENSDE